VGFRAFEGFFIKTFFVIGVALACFLGLFAGPSLPTRALRCCDLKLYAIDWTNGDTQFTTRTKRLDHRVHAFVGADDRVSWAGVQAKGASNAPLLVNESHLSGPLKPKSGVQERSLLVGQFSESTNTFLPTWRALVDGRVLMSHAFRVGFTVLKATAFALGLGQEIQKTLRE
jgi:hypothetical protein